MQQQAIKRQQPIGRSKAESKTKDMWSIAISKWASSKPILATARRQHRRWRGVEYYSRGWIIIS